MAFYHIGSLSINLQGIVLIGIKATHTDLLYFYPRFHFERDLGSVAVGDAPCCKHGCMINVYRSKTYGSSFYYPSDLPVNTLKYRIYGKYVSYLYLNRSHPTSI